MHCHRHPERQARRRCFRCHRLLCASCQTPALHHLFCSWNCILLYGFEEVLSCALGGLHSLLAIPPIRVRETRRWGGSVALIALSAIIVLSSQQRLCPLQRTPTLWPKEACYLKPSFDGSSPVGVASSGSKRDISAHSPPSLPAQPQALMKLAHSSSPSSPLRKGSLSLGEEKQGGGEYEDVPDISRGNLARKEVALTFDGGGWANAASEILATLRDKEIACTFFLSGEFIRRYPDLVREIVEDRHEVANHTESHPHLTSYAANSRQELLPWVNRRFLWRQLIGAEELFSELTGKRMAPFWRAPYGEQNSTLRRWAKEIGYQHISWTSDDGANKSLDSLDWVADPSQKMYCSAEEVRNRILGYGDGANGGIILMHLGTSRRRDQIHERLGEIIEGLQERGYRLVKVSELVEGREMTKGDN